MSICYPMVIPAAAVGYTGPGDVVSGAAAWWGLRAYNAAYAASGTQPAIDIQDSADANDTTINILTTGALDMATLNAWIGTHGTAFVQKVYDQTGNGVHLTDGTLTSTNEPRIAVSGGFASLLFSRTTDEVHIADFGTAISQPYTMSCVMRRNIVSVPSLQLSRVLVTAGGPIDIGFSAAGNEIAIRSGGGRIPASATDDAWHRVQAVWHDAVQTRIYVDTTNNNISVGDTTNQVDGDTTLGVAGAFSAGNAGSTTNVYEFGVWSGAFSVGTQCPSMSENQRAYWGL